MPTLADPHFDLIMRCSADEWTTRPARLYEMSDGLWYPLSDLAMSTPDGMSIFLHTLDDTVRRVRQVRRCLRQLGADRRQAFSATTMLLPGARGFHSTRASSADFIRMRRADWLGTHTRPSVMSPPQDEAEFEALAEAMWLP